MSTKKLVLSMTMVLTSIPASAAVVNTNVVKVTQADGNAMYCQAVNISDSPQEVKTQLISYDGSVIESHTDTVAAGQTIWPISRAATADGSVLARCKFTVNKTKVRGAIAVFKDNGNGSIELLLEAR